MNFISRDVAPPLSAFPMLSGFSLFLRYNAHNFTTPSTPWNNFPFWISTISADPPHNIKKADWDSFESQKHYIAWSIQWIWQASQVLKPTGSLYVCGFSEILADLKHPTSQYFKHFRWLIWQYKNKANLGSDWGVTMRVSSTFASQK